MSLSRRKAPQLFDMLDALEKPRDEQDRFRLPTLEERMEEMRRQRGTAFRQMLWCSRCDAQTLHDGMPTGEGVLAYSCQCGQGSRLFFNRRGRPEREYVLPSGNPDPKFQFDLAEMARFLRQGTQRCRCYGLGRTGLFLFSRHCVNRLRIWRS